MNGKAALCFTLAGLCALGAVGYFLDGIKAMETDAWRDAVHYSPNGATADATGNVKIVTEDAESTAE